MGGNEGVGEVVEVGAGVSSVRVGDWVIPVDAGFGEETIISLNQEAT